MQIVSLGDILPEKTVFFLRKIRKLGDNLHEIAKSVLGKNKKNISNWRLLKLLTNVLSVNKYPTV